MRAPAAEPSQCPPPIPCPARDRASSPPFDQARSAPPLDWPRRSRQAPREGSGPWPRTGSSPRRTHPTAGTGVASRPRPSGPRRGRTIWRGCRRPRSVRATGSGAPPCAPGRRAKAGAGSTSRGPRRPGSIRGTRAGRWRIGSAATSTGSKFGELAFVAHRRMLRAVMRGDAAAGPALAPRRSGHGDGRGRERADARGGRGPALPPQRRDRGPRRGRSGLIGLIGPYFRVRIDRARTPA
jgi:hypothetical protein